MTVAEYAQVWAREVAVVPEHLRPTLVALASRCGEDGRASSPPATIAFETVRPVAVIIADLAHLSVLGIITRVLADPPTWALALGEQRTEMPLEYPRSWDTEP